VATYQAPGGNLTQRPGETDEQFRARAVEMAKSNTPDMMSLERQPGGLAVTGGKDIAKGDVAKGTNEILSAVGPTALAATAPFTATELTLSPVKALTSIAGGAVAGYGAKKTAEEVGATPDQAVLAGTVGNVAGAMGVPLLGKLPIWSRLSPATTVEEALGRKLTPPEADAARPAGQIQPALNNTPREVITHASDEGIKLTPGQATEDAMAQNLQKAGTTAAVGGKELTAALREQQAKFGESVNNFMDTVDPKRGGLSTEQAGETIQDTVKTAKSVSHENASNGYKQIDYLMDRPVNPTPISNAWNQLKGGLPMGAEEQILAQTPRSMRAVVEDLLSGRPEGFKPTFAQGIELRSFFRNLGDTEGLPDKTEAIFKQMSGVVDSAMDASAGPRDVDNWRSANSGWKDYSTKYGDRNSVLYKAIRQGDPTRIVTSLENAPATDIETLRNETTVRDAKGNITNDGPAIDALQRQVVQDIAKSRFRIGHDGLGGYSDAYLKALFDPDAVKELYLKADLANRINYDPNPSGTGANISSLSQLSLWNQTKMSAAAKMSMPRDPLSFLPESSNPKVTVAPPAPARSPFPIASAIAASAPKGSLKDLSASQ
jgi:hypothetical protein